MTWMPSMPALVGLVLFTAILVASARLLLALRAGRLGVARCVWMLVLQAVAVVLLHLVMFPPPGTREAGVLTVLTGGGSSQGRYGAVVALPEHAGSGVERAPDLSTALRQRPGTRGIVVRGNGLAWRDHDAARDVEVVFEAGPEPSGMVELQVPRNVVAGQRIVLRGRVNGLDAPLVELLDPAGIRLARASPDGDGRFSLPVTMHAPGAVEFSLRVRDDDETVDETSVAVSVEEGEALRALLLAGAPGPELRALRRWAIDAGVALESRIQLSRDASLGQPPDVDPAELDTVDLLMLELRTWRTFDPARREAVRAAIETGMGMLLRLDDVPNEDDRASLWMLGFETSPVEAGDGTVQLHPMHLGHVVGNDGDVGAPGSSGAARLTRRPLRVEAADAAVLLRSDDDLPLAVWRGHGQGRVALWWLDDTHPLVAMHAPQVHANLWSMVVSTLSRPRTLPSIDTGADAGVSGRRVLCGLGAGAQVATPGGGDVIALAVDAGGCAGFWPEAPGWHAVLDAGQRVAFHVGASQTLDAYAMREATQRLAARPWRGEPVDRVPVPGSPWPWFAGFLAAAAALWWLERRRPPSSPTSRTGRPE